MMLIIGEKINGTRKQVAEAIKARNKEFIQDLAHRQAEAGAHYLDVNAGTGPDLEADALVWLVDVVQEAVNVPLCLDSANPNALAAAMERVERVPLVNSISGEKKRLDNILPIAAKHACPVIGLAMDDIGLPKNTEDRLVAIRRVVHETERVGLSHDKLYIDPLVMAVATDTTSGLTALETMRAVLTEYPDVHLTSGLSNISFGLPTRGLINRVFLSLALAAGLDCAIMDPLDRDLYGELLAVEAVLGRDRFCRNYTRAYSSGKIGPLMEEQD